jgi:uncharacterized membrane protein
MEAFLAVIAVVLFVSGSLFMLSPASVEKISKATNRALFNLDDKIQTVRRPLGISLFLTAIFLLYVALYS